MADMEERVIKVPMAFAGNETEPPIPDLLGVDVEVMAITVNYRDVGKVRVKGTQRQLSDLQQRSDAWFEKHWPKPERN